MWSVTLTSVGWAKKTPTHGFELFFLDRIAFIVLCAMISNQRNAVLARGHTKGREGAENKTNDAQRQVHATGTQLRVSSCAK